MNLSKMLPIWNVKLMVGITLDIEVMAINEEQAFVSAMTSFRKAIPNHVGTVKAVEITKAGNHLTNS